MMYKFQLNQKIPTKRQFMTTDMVRNRKFKKLTLKLKH